MIFAADIGNTNIMIGGFDKKRGEILFTERISTKVRATDFEYAISFRNALEMHGAAADDVEGAVISSVVPGVTGAVKAAIEKIAGVTPLVVGPGIRTGLSIRIDDPAQLGSDLVVGAVAGIHAYPCPLAIIDLGTANIISVIDKNRCYLGGMLMPGIRVSLEALSGRAPQLPHIGFEAPGRLIGKNTVECMKSGILYGNASCIDGLLARIEEELGESLFAVATGGLASVIAPLCRKKIVVDDDLMLKGLMIIYNKNQ